jgi:thioredoxin-related protein
VLDRSPSVKVPGKIARTSRETFLYLPGKRCRYCEDMNKAETNTRDREEEQR